jgi:lipoprotein-anchoring transpeptidase ErfK/SrfK
MGAGFAKERELNGPAPGGPSASVTEEAGAFAGGAAPADNSVTRVARRTVRSARVHAERVDAPERGRVVSIRRGRSARLHLRPGGRAVALLGDRTPFGSRTELAVVRRKRGWVGVLTSALPNGTVGWIRDDESILAGHSNRIRIAVDRSDQRLDLMRGTRRLMSVAVGVGRPGSETPTGRFAVTDKLPGARYTRGYGCCILALSGRQPQLPAGWRGGDRLAIHGTDGRSAPTVRSAGCVTVDRAPLERLIRAVPLGTVVTIRP